MTPQSAKETKLPLPIWFVWEWIKNWWWAVFPAIPTVWTWIGARMENSPIWFAILVSSLVFWAIMSGLRAAREFLSKVSVKNKLIPIGIQGGHQTDQKGKIVALQAGLMLGNASENLIEYKVEQIRTMIDGRVNPNPLIHNYGEAVPPMVVTTYRDDGVPVQNLRPGQTLEGTFDITFEYGKPGKVKYKASRSYIIKYKIKSPSQLEAFQYFNK